MWTSSVLRAKQTNSLIRKPAVRTLCLSYQWRHSTLQHCLLRHQNLSLPVSSARRVYYGPHSPRIIASTASPHPDADTLHGAYAVSTLHVPFSRLTITIIPSAWTAGDPTIYTAQRTALVPNPTTTHIHQRRSVILPTTATPASKCQPQSQPQ